MLMVTVTTYDRAGRELAHLIQVMNKNDTNVRFVYLRNVWSKLDIKRMPTVEAPGCVGRVGPDQPRPRHHVWRFELRTAKLFIEHSILIVLRSEE